MSAWLSVIDNPSSLSARIALRDEWMRTGDPRGELVSRALQLRDGIVPSTEYYRVLDEFNALLEKHRRDWAGPIAEKTDRFHYELGMPSRLGVSANELVLHGEELVSSAPIVHLGISGPGDVVAAVRSPALRRIRTVGVGWGATVDDEVVMAIAASPYVTNVRGLYLRHGAITTRGLNALGASPYLMQLVFADLTGNPCEGKVQKFDSGRYYLGPASEEFMQRARDRAAESYGSRIEWPPLDDEITWTD